MKTQGHEGCHSLAPQQPARLTYTVAESADLIGISPALLWRLIAERRVPVLRLGRRTLVTRQTIEGLVAEGSQPDDGDGRTAYGVRVVHPRKGAAS